MHNLLTVKWDTAQAIGRAANDPRAAQLFDRALRSPKSTGLRRWLGQAVTPLRSLVEVTESACLTHRSERGTRAVSLDQIAGSVNKTGDFDALFRPLQRHSENRWLRVATAMLRGVDLPPIELVQMGELYFVKDGHHRISVARALHYRYLDAAVTVWAVESECAAA